MPTITIGMPVFNGERYVEEALRSILAQTFQDFELILSDNASTDRTWTIAERVAAQDSRVILKRNPKNLGAAPNYNALVELARGRYFKWAAHDDLLHPAFLEACLRALENHPQAVLCAPATVMMDASGAATGEDPFDVVDVSAPTPHERLRQYLRQAWPRCGCNAVFGLIRLESLRFTRRVGSYASSDKILLGELAMLGRFHRLSDPYFRRREHLDSSVRANPGVEERNRWFDTTSSLGGGFIRWKWTWEYLRGIMAVPLSPAEKMRCALALREYLLRERMRLAAELKRPVKRLIRRQPRR